MTQPPYGQSSGPYSQDRFPTGPSGPRPKEVDQSFYLWIATIVVSVVSLVVGFGQIGTAQQQAIDEAAATDPTVDPALIAQFVAVGIVIGLLLVLVLLALELLFAFKMRAGRNWARITLAVLGGISLLLFLPSLFSPGDLTVVQLVLTGASTLLLVGAIVLMFVKGANPWFQGAGPREVT